MQKHILQEKKEFVAIDMAKVICTLRVVAIHLNPLRDVNNIANYFLVNVISRAGVPFFLRLRLRMLELKSCC